MKSVVEVVESYEQNPQLPCMSIEHPERSNAE